MDKQSSENEEIVIPVMGKEDDMEQEIRDERDGGEEGKETPAERPDYLDQLRRLQAEFMNYRKRVEKERLRDFQTAKAQLMEKLLPVLDDFERMISHLNDDDYDPQGVKLIYQNFQKVMFDEKLEVIDTVGQVFDPECHEAVGVVETDESGDGQVMEEWQKGYRLGDRLIRPSRVAVGKYVEKDDDE